MRLIPYVVLTVVVLAVAYLMIEPLVSATANSLIDSAHKIENPKEVAR